MAWKHFCVQRTDVIREATCGGQQQVLWLKELVVSLCVPWVVCPEKFANKRPPKLCLGSGWSLAFCMLFYFIFHFGFDAGSVWVPFRSDHPSFIYLLYGLHPHSLSHSHSLSLSHTLSLSLWFPPPPPYLFLWMCVCERERGGKQTSRAEVIVGVLCSMYMYICVVLERGERDGVFVCGYV